MLGGSGRPRFEIAAWTSCAAASILRLESELDRDRVMPCEFVELICSMPAMVENWRSSGVATADAMVSGIGAGQRGGHLDGRIIDAGQRGHGQRAVADDAEQQNGER